VYSSKLNLYFPIHKRAQMVESKTTTEPNHDTVEPSDTLP
jgi:hypothetical protein